MAKLRELSEKAFSSATSIELIRSGNTFFDSLEKAIDHARIAIHFQTYILDPDETGNRIMAALIRAAGRGVKVYLVVDAYGSNHLTKKEVNQLTEAGIHFKWFEPIFDFKNLSIGRRLHHKLVVFDTDAALIGGINISNHYNYINNNVAWLDFAVMVKGEVVRKIRDRALQILDKEIREKISKEEPPKPPKEDLSFPVRHLVNDWLQGKNEVIQSTRKAFGKATSSIFIVGSYFHPGRKLRAILRAATRRNVEVKIILTHESDIPFSTKATRYFYRWMFRNNICIYEWKHSVLHGKAAIVDGNWVSIGSFNFNFLSSFESIELNLEILNRSFANSFQKTLDDITTKDCLYIDPESFEKKYNFIKRTTDWISYQIIRYSMRFPMLFATKKREEKRKWR